MVSFYVWRLQHLALRSFIHGGLLSVARGTQLQSCKDIYVCTYVYVYICERPKEVLRLFLLKT